MLFGRKKNNALNPSENQQSDCIEIDPEVMERVNGGLESPDRFLERNRAKVVKCPFCKKEKSPTERCPYCHRR